MEDAKQDVMEHEAAVEKVEDDFDSKADEFLDEAEKDTSQDSSTETKPEEEETSETEDSSAETEKTEKSEEKEEEVPKEFHKHPAWQRILKERDEARKSVEEKESQLPTEEIEKFNKVTSSPAYIKASMQAEGYTQEAINNKLQELGHTVETPPQDDIKLVMKELKIDPDTLNEESKNYLNTYVADAAKVADIIVRDRLQKLLPEELGGIKKDLEGLTQQSSANTLVDQMRTVIKDEGVLDFKKDIEPSLDKFLKENPEATQQDALNHFKELSRRLTIERLQGKGKKQERTEKKENLRQNAEGTNLYNLGLEKSGNFDKDADGFLDKLGIN